MPLSPYTRRRMSFSPPAAACVTVNVPRAPSVEAQQRRRVVDAPCGRAPARRRRRIRARSRLPATKQARCCAWQPMALMTSDWPLRAGSRTQRRRLVCGASSSARRHAALDVLDLHEADVAERAVVHELARVARHRIGGVRVRDREQPRVRVACARRGRALRRASSRHRLVAHDVEPGVERGRGDRIVRVVRAS